MDSSQTICVADAGSLLYLISNKTPVPDLGKKVKENCGQILHLLKATADKQSRDGQENLSERQHWS